MYNCNRALRYFLSTFLAVQVVAEAVVNVLVVARWKRGFQVQFPAGSHNVLLIIDAVKGLPPPLPTCFGGVPDKNVWTYWVPMLSFESILFAAALFKAFKVTREEAFTPRILTVLLRDSIAYFGGVGAIAVTNLVVWTAARVSIVSVLRCTTVADQCSQLSLVVVATG